RRQSRDGIDLGKRSTARSPIACLHSETNLHSETLMSTSQTMLPHVRASSVSRALAIVGDRWTLLILREAFFGVRRFEEWRRRLCIARSLLTDRLRRLVEAGVLERALYAEM